MIFFPGDISDFASRHAAYSYSLEAWHMGVKKLAQGLLWVLCSKFPNDNVILARGSAYVTFTRFTWQRKI